MNDIELHADLNEVEQPLTFEYAAHAFLEREVPAIAALKRPRMSDWMVRLTPTYPDLPAEPKPADLFHILGPDNTLRKLTRQESAID